MFILDIDSWTWHLDLVFVTYLLCPCIPLCVLCSSAYHSCHLSWALYFNSFTLYATSLCCHQSPKRGRLWETWPLEVMVSVINDILIMLLRSSWHEGIISIYRAHWLTKWDPSIQIYWRTARWLDFLATRSRIDSSKCCKVERRALRDYLLVSR